MKGSEFKAIREKFGLGRVLWMYALGYTGNDNTMKLRCQRYENGRDEIPLYLARYVWLLEQARGRWPGPPGGQLTMPDWPEWPTYYVDEEPAL